MDGVVVGVIVVLALVALAAYCVRGSLS